MLSDGSKKFFNSEERRPNLEPKIDRQPPNVELDIEATTDQLLIALEQHNFDRANRQLEQLSSLSNRQLLRFWHLQAPFKALKAEYTPRWAKDVLRRLWLRGQRLIPRDMWRRTINAFGSGKMDMIDLYNDPLLGFRIDRELFNSPILIELFLHSLRGILGLLI